MTSDPTDFSDGMILASLPPMGQNCLNQPVLHPDQQALLFSILPWYPGALSSSQVPNRRLRWGGGSGRGPVVREQWRHERLELQRWRTDARCRSRGQSIMLHQSGAGAVRKRDRAGDGVSRSSWRRRGLNQGGLDTHLLPVYQKHLLVLRSCIISAEVTIIKSAQ